MLSQLLPSVFSECESTGFLAEEGENSYEKISLNLGIGSCANARLKKRDKNIKQEKREALFTAAQFQEFYSQILVYNSITLGLPLAFHLLLPIWIYPSFAGLNLHNSDRSIVMDLEPGRCRRTDGRKWRCSKNVVPCQKYCERHVNRGRRRSRKRVEPIESACRHDSVISDDNHKMPIMTSIASDMDNIVNLDENQHLQANPECKNNQNCDDLFSIRTTDDVCSVGDEVKKNTVFDYSTSTCSNSKYNFATNEGDYAEGKSSSGNANPKIVGMKWDVTRNNCVGFVSRGFGLSPKSVLHCVAGKVDFSLDSNVTETEPQRCRRTDGKKWRCRRDTLTNQKYCDAHMHRGAKKLVLNPQSVSNSLATCARRAQGSSHITRNLDDGINLNTVPDSPQHVTCNDSSGMSDATTATDENMLAGLV